MQTRRAFIALVLTLPLVLSACGSSTSTTTTGAVNASSSSAPAQASNQPMRPAPLLSIYVNILLADGLAVPVTAARDGVAAQLQILAPPSAQTVDDLYSLLDEFGAVLHVNVPDILNRSDNRAKTLDDYDTGLKNITERVTRRSSDLKDQLTTIKTTEQKQRSDVSALSTQASNAVKANDFATAQDAQAKLQDAQGTLAQTDAQIKELTTIQTTMTNLLSIAQQRIAALDSNRELLIAGLKAVDVPGVEDLGVISGSNGSARPKGFSPFGGM